MPNPQCTVNNQNTLSEVSVPASSSVTIALQDATGVNGWSLVCTKADPLHQASTFTASVAINMLAKTATVIVPADPCALVFQSTVNQGINQNGDVDPALSSAFEIHVPTASGLLPVAIGETSEANAARGWAGKIDALIRNAAMLPTGLATGDILYVSGGRLQRLPIGTSGQVLKVVAGLPAWVTGP